MTAVIQIVDRAKIYTDSVFNGEIEKGLYILLGVSVTDTDKDAEILSEKISKLRIFKDENDKMNLSVTDVDGDVMVVSNFTLNANYSHGNRPDYLSSAKPEIANTLYEYFVSLISTKVKKTVTGKFGSDMVTDMLTHGPVTIVMDSNVFLRREK